MLRKAATPLSYFNKPFFIHNGIWEEMVQHCLDEKPYEACGILSGMNGIAKTIWKMENIDQSPNSFSMDLHQIETTFRTIHKHDETFQAIYHSHPTAKAFPSYGDIASHNYPEVSYIIISLALPLPEVNCFLIKGDKVIKQSINRVG